MSLYLNDDGSVSELRWPVPDSQQLGRTQRWALIFTELSQERIRQLDRWGEQRHPDGTGGRTRRRKAEMAKERCDMAHKLGLDTWDLILKEEVCEAMAESDPVRLRAELIQSAAVIVAWIEDLDQRNSTSAEQGIIDGP